MAGQGMKLACSTAESTGQWLSSVRARHDATFAE
jgi:hypothetical protein